MSVCVFPPQLVCVVDGRTLSVRVHTHIHTIGCWALCQTFSSVLINYTSEMYEHISRYGIFVKPFFVHFPPIGDFIFPAEMEKKLGKIPRKREDDTPVQCTIINHEL